MEQWLVSLYGSLTAVPEYEKTNASIELLYNLMSASKESTYRSKAITSDLNNRAEEYRAKGASCLSLSVLFACY